LISKKRRRWKDDIHVSTDINNTQFKATGRELLFDGAPFAMQHQEPWHTSVMMCVDSGLTSKLKKHSSKNYIFICLCGIKSRAPKTHDIMENAL
jgi:hypothetical protein